VAGAIESIFSHFQSQFGFSFCKKKSKYSSVNFKFTARYYYFVLKLKLISMSNKWKELLNQYFSISKANLDSVYAKRSQNTLQ
jgi:hypothetical protein